MNKAVKVLPFVLFLYLTGCISTGMSNKIQNYSLPIHEFDTSLTEGSFRIITAVSSPSEIYIEGILAGEGRILKVIQSENSLYFKEVSKARKSEGTLIILKQTACCLDEELFRRLIFLKKGERAEISDVLKGQKIAGEITYPASILVMDFTNIYTFSSQQIVWEKPGVVSASYGVVKKYEDVMDVSWNRRSRTVYGMMHGAYLFTVPADIITSPFQLAGVLLLGKSVVK